LQKPVVTSFLKQESLRLLLFGGKGGVGKTTCATAAALHMAKLHPEAEFLLVSVDPAHSLTDSLGDMVLPPNLQVLEMDGHKCLSVFLERHRLHLKEIAKRGTFLDEADINRFLDLSPPGMDEILALVEIVRWVESEAFRTILVDTAPTGHVLRLIAMPDLLRQWLAALDSMLEKHRFLRSRFQGSHKPDELDNFLNTFASSLQSVERLLRDPERCRFVPVTVAAEVVLQETTGLLCHLQELQVPVQEILVNRISPLSDCLNCLAARRRQQELLSSYSANFSRYRLYGLPLYPQEMRGSHLQEFWEGAKEMVPAAARVTTGTTCHSWQIHRPNALPSLKTIFWLFAGKGGVGKSTIACATALRLRQEYAAKKILLISTDPAHSLTSCLGVAIGPKPVQVLPGLTSVEIDAAGTFASLKKQFRRELENFWQSANDHLTLPFDRVVMERLLDLAPPGLDEIISLTRIVDFLEQGKYDLLVLDTAPTGHLLRLLELPELIGQWLKQVFGLFLRYRLSVYLPKLSQQLVRLSKGLKQLRSLWRDPVRSALMVVSIPTTLALEETADLWNACGRLGLPIRGGFLNCLTPASSHCLLCSAWNRNESRILGKFRNIFDGRPMTLVYQNPEPKGIAALTALGQSLYQSSTLRPEAHLKSKSDIYAGRTFPAGERHVPISG
jgi:arsenite/tail-anchored protein-transporting ATPase